MILVKMVLVTLASGRINTGPKIGSMLVLAEPLVAAVNAPATPITLVVPREPLPLMYHPTVGSTPYAVVDGVQVVGGVAGQLVRLDLSAEYGAISLNQNFSMLADFTYCSQRWEHGTEWRCKGDGVSDRSMTFVADASNVGRILTNLSYTSFFEDKEDAITFQLFHGVGGDCLSIEEQSSTAGVISGGCYGHRAMVHIGRPGEDMVGGGSVNGNSRADTASMSGLTWAKVFRFIFYFMFAVTFVGVGWCFYRCCCGQCRRGTTAVGPENEV